MSSALPIALALAWSAASARVPATRVPAAPAAADTVRTIVFGSCADQDRPQPIWDAILREEPDLFLFVGDNIYADTENMDTMRAKYARLAAVPGFQRLRATTPIVATWDDHDYGVNDGGAEYPLRDESQRLFMDFFGVPDTAAMRSRPGVYSAHVFGPPGQRVQVILLDTRSFRGPLTRRPEGAEYERPGRYVPGTDTTVTMLGQAQWEWLRERLREPAELRLLVSSIQVIAEEHGWEKWANLPHERRRLFRLLRDTGAEGVVILSGDRHLAELSRLDADDPDGIGYPLYDLTSSGLNKGMRIRNDEPNRHRLGRNFTGNNFGVIAIEWQDDPVVSLEIRDSDGEPVLRHQLRLRELGRPAPGTTRGSG